uniref:Uncharacterized protein n=1 Tax=Populus alba TaxID=43335 RepID=A0A4U5Q6Q1_POPAL|nr:hypothetical protein D5086_0000135290 [Populus alba]
MSSPQQTTTGDCTSLPAGPPSIASSAFPRSPLYFDRTDSPHSKPFPQASPSTPVFPQVTQQNSLTSTDQRTGRVVLSLTVHSPSRRRSSQPSTATPTDPDRSVPPPEHRQQAHLHCGFNRRTDDRNSNHSRDPFAAPPDLAPGAEEKKTEPLTN